MISELTTTGGAPASSPVPATAPDLAPLSLRSSLTMATNLPGNDRLIAALDGECGLIQPVVNVAAYLATRTPQPMIEGEEGLLITLPVQVQKETRALVRACKFVQDLKQKVQPACQAALRVFKKWPWKLNTFRPKYDAWAKAKDWVVLVNRAKAPAAWKLGNAGLPEEFLVHMETLFGRFGRSDAKRQAVLSIKRHWQTGRDFNGVECVIPGYAADWKKRDTENLPAGWGYDNICTQIKNRNRATKAALALLHDSESAARQYLPQALRTRRDLRFLEKITFDDVRTDWLIFNPKSGEAEEMWVLVARDEASAMVLGFVLHPATVREDGKATHLGAQQMKELAAYLLQTYPLPPYLIHWVVERGTATLAEAVKAALGELFNSRIAVHYTSMIGDKSPVGYKEKAKGNSRGKASHEAHNRLFHTQGSHVMGQTGAHYSIRPADLKARCDEAKAIWTKSRELPESLRDQVKYPLPTPVKARELFAQFCNDQNHRTEHDLEDFDEVLEVFIDGKWQPVQTVPNAGPGATLRKRKEMPVERAMRLIQAVDRWDRVAPDVVITFLAHSQRLEKIEANGEIKMTHQGKLLNFANPGVQLPAGTKVLCYHNAQEPEFLHVTSGDGRVHGTWVLRGRGAFLDAEATAKAMRYTHAARAAAVATATELAAPQRAELDAMRAHNASLQDFVQITDAPNADGTARSGSVGAAFEQIKTTGGEMKINPPAVVPVEDGTDDLLARLSSAPNVKFD